MIITIITLKKSFSLIPIGLEKIIPIGLEKKLWEKDFASEFDRKKNRSLVLKRTWPWFSVAWLTGK